MQATLFGPLFFVPMYQPNWDKHDVRTVKGAEAFVEDRDRETAANPTAKAWEESRKRSLQSQKRDYHLKEEASEQAELKETLKDLKTGGEFDQDLFPAPGFILIRPERHTNETDTGLLLPDSVNPTPNTGEIVALGGQDLEIGRRVLYKKGAGLEIVVRGQVLLLMRCVEDLNLTDILGVFK